MRFVAEVGGSFNSIFGIGKVAMMMFGNLMIVAQVVNSLFFFDTKENKDPLQDVSGINDTS